MTILQELVEAVRTDEGDAAVSQVLVGLRWTAVHSRNLGLAATQADAACCRARDIEGVGKLEQRSALQLCDLLFSGHPLEVSIGMAALNSLIRVDEQAGVDWNARDLMLEKGRQKKMAVIGHFPFVDSLRQVAEKMWVLELDPAPDEFPAAMAEEILPQADIIGLTATTLMNGTFEGLCRLFPPQAWVVMMGPSTPMSPVLFDYGVDVLAGALVAQPERLLPYLRQGTTLHKVEGLRRFTLTKENLSTFFR